MAAARRESRRCSAGLILCVLATENRSGIKLPLSVSFSMFQNVPCSIFGVHIFFYMYNKLSKQKPSFTFCSCSMSNGEKKSLIFFSWIQGVLITCCSPFNCFLVNISSPRRKYCCCYGWASRNHTWDYICIKFGRQAWNIWVSITAEAVIPLRGCIIPTGSICYPEP